MFSTDIICSIKKICVCRAFRELLKSLHVFHVIKGVRKGRREGTERARRGRRNYVCLASTPHERPGFRPMKALQNDTIKNCPSSYWRV